MIEHKKSNIIDASTLQKLNSIQGKYIASMFCYLWINQINPKQPIDVIDAVEFNFSDGDKIVLSSNEIQEGLIATDYDFEQKKSNIDEQFAGKLKLYKVNIEKTEMWQNIIHQKITNITLEKDKETGNFLCDKIIFKFENQEMRLIQVHPIDGIILDYYEEV